MASKLVLVVLFAVAAYMLYSPVPEYLNEVPLRMKLALAVLHNFCYLPAVAELTGLGSALNVTRWMRNIVTYALPDTSDLQVEWQDTIFDGVPVRIYTPKQVAEKSPAILYIHGGGFIANDVPMYDEFCIRLAATINVVVVSVEYRLAPEYVFPTSMDDCERALRHLMKHASQWKVDPARIGISGDSAGGALTAGLVLRLRDTKEKLPYPIKFQFLIFPFLQMHNITTVSHLLNRDDPIVPRDLVCLLLYMFGWEVPEPLRKAGYNDLFEINKAMLRNDHTFASPSVIQRINKILDPQLYTNVHTKEDYELVAQIPQGEVEISSASTAFTAKEAALSAYMEKYIFNPEFSPLLAQSLKGLPPTYILACEADILRDDSLLYNERLKAAGVNVHLQRYKKYHGYTLFEAKKPIDDFAKYVQEKKIL